MECTNPQYIVRATDPNYHTEIFSVEPGAYPAIVNQIPPGKPTVPEGEPTEMLRAIANVLVKAGHCTVPENLEAPVEQEVSNDTPSSIDAIPDALGGALERNILSRTTQQTQAIEEVQSTPDIYQRKTETLNAPGSEAGSLLAAVIGIPVALGASRYAFLQVQKRMFPTSVDNEVMNNYEIEQPANIYEHPQHMASVSSAPTPEPSPWVRPGNAYQEGRFGRNEAPKRVRNEFEMTRNEAEMTSEMGFISPEMRFSNPEQLNRVKQRLSGILKTGETVATQAVSVEMNSEMKPISGYFDPAGDLTRAKDVYFSLRDNGVSKATDLGGAIFGIRGGDKWASVSPILQSWSNEWEERYGSVPG